MDAKNLVVLITAPSLEVAEEIGKALVQKRLAACANLLKTGVRSIYRWQGQVEMTDEVLLIIKTTEQSFTQGLIPAVLALHPYETPEIVALPIEHGLDAYLNWIAAETGPQE